MALFKFTCKHCSQIIEAETNMIGQTAKCPTCGREIIIEKDIFSAPQNHSPNPNQEEEKMRMLPASGKIIDLPLWCKFAAGAILLVNLLLLLVVVRPKTWEYKAVKITGDITKYDYKMEKFFPVELKDENLTTSMNLFYSKWDLVGTITEIETVHPNFGKEDYVTGIQPNTRSFGTILIFRRQKLF